MRNFEIPHESDNVGEMGRKKTKIIDADSILEQRKRATEEVEGGRENADVYQPDNKKEDFEKKMAGLDPDRVIAERGRREQEAKTARLAREQQIKTQDQKRIDEIRNDLGLSGTPKDLNNPAERGGLLEGNGWHEVKP